MATSQASIPFLLSAKAASAMVQYCRLTREACWTDNKFRNKLQLLDSEFYRENMLFTGDHSVARLTNAAGDKKKIQDVCMPIIESQVETSVAFLSSVFLTGNPIFDVVADPANMNQAKNMRAVISENANRGSWASELVKFFRDGEKYNIHALEVDWKKETIYSPVMQVNPGGQNTTKNKETVWEGNCLKRVDPYNLLFDMRVAPHEMHKKGEFVGYSEIMSRIALKQFIQDLPNRMNVTEAFASSFDESLYFIPKINPLDNYQLSQMQGKMDWLAWAGQGIKRLDYKSIYVVITRYCRIIPSDFGIQVPRANMPQIWKFITVNDKVVIYAERQTNAHNFLPIVVGQPYNDGLAYQTKGKGEKLIPIQDLASAAWNARLAIQRRKVGDRGIYDPSRVSSDNINSENPSAKIPVKPSAYGKDVREAYHAIPFEDNQSGSYVQDGQEFIQFGNMISGQNQAQQGQFVKGNKTRHEYEDVQSNSSGRQRTSAIFIENQTFTPIKEIIKLNILQYQPDGPLVSPVDGAVYQVNKEELRKAALQMQISDGLTPNDKLIDSDTLQVALQVVGSSPQLQAEFNFGGMFSYLMSLKGADLSPFLLSQVQKQQARVQSTQQVASDAAAESAGTTLGATAAGNPPVPPTPQ